MQPSSLTHANRRGITLLEVLIAMFVLTVGILSIFALFTAGRELESKAAIKSSAIAFAASQRGVIGTQWLDWPQWLAKADPIAEKGTFRWAKPDAGGQLPIVLPVLVDPWGLCADADVRKPGDPWETAPNPAVYWDWSRFVPLTSAIAGSAGDTQPFQRVTLSRTERPAPFDAASPLIPPFDREAALATFSDEDSIEYGLPPDANDPPLNAFEAGRRKRGTDLVPALFIAATGTATGANLVKTGTPVRRSLLVFHKPVPDFESYTDQKSGSTQWPSGAIELRVIRHEQGLIVAKLLKEPDDSVVVRRSLRPGKWVLFTNRLPRLAGPYFYDARWRELTSVTQDTDGSWLIVVKTDLPEEWPMTPEPAGNDPIVEWSPLYPVPGNSPPPQTYSPIYCYAFERLVHVEELLDEATLKE